MPYELVYPNDTLNEIDEFLTTHFTGYIAENAAIDAIDDELGRLALDPTIGRLARRVGSWNRREHGWAFAVGRVHTRVHVQYQDRVGPPTVIVYGFGEARNVVL